MTALLNKPYVNVYSIVQVSVWV